MVDWRVLAVTVPILFATYQSITKLLPKGSPTFLITAYASFIGVIIMLLLHLLTSDSKSIALPTRTLWIALAAGACISFGNWGIIKALSSGASQSAFSLIFYTTLIVYGTIFGLLFWQEKLNLVQLLGLALSCAGIFLVFFFKK